MGCDIHFHSEVKIKGQWIHHCEMEIGRNYNLFAKMAGIRNYNEIVPISNPKGFPLDATFLTTLHSDRYGSDGHSHSWLSASEIKKLYDWIDDNEHGDFGEFFTMRNFPSFMNMDFDGFKKYPDEWEGVEDVRFVFFFDN